MFLATAAYWDSVDRIITQTQGRAFQTLGRAFDLLLRLQKLDRVFRKLSRVFEKLGRVFSNRYFVECFVKESS